MRAAVMAWLAASHRRHPADTGKLQAAVVAKAAPAEHDRYARCLASNRLDTRGWPPSESDRRLQGLESWQAIAATVKCRTRPDRPSNAVFPVLTGQCNRASGE